MLKHPERESAHLAGDSLGDYICALVFALTDNGVLTPEQFEAAMLKVKLTRANGGVVPELKKHG